MENRKIYNLQSAGCNSKVRSRKKRFYLSIINCQLSIVLLLPLFLCSCQQQKTNPPKDCNSIVGVWKAVDYPLVIKINKQCKITSAIIPMGEVMVLPNKTTQVEVQSGEMSFYQAGNFILEYLPNTNQISAEVDIEHIYVPFVNDKIEGHVKYIVSGSLSEDNQRWDGILMEIFDYGPRFPMDPNGIGESITLLKEKDQQTKH